MTNINDVTGLEASIDAQMQATNVAFQGCTTVAPADLTSWAGFYSEWLAEKEKIDSYVSAGWWNLGAKIAEVAQVSTFYGELQGYGEQLKVWQSRLAQSCPNYTPPPSPLPPAPPNPPTPVDWNTIVKYGGIGIAALAGVYVVKSIKDIF